MPNPGGAGLRAGALSTTDLDIAAFFGRLQRAAQRCSGPRSGEGKIRFCVGVDGAPIDVALVQSTGNFALDDAALHCVIPGAAPFPHTDRCLVVPLAFH
jgi:outer membrane biosynthesis protein TonB